jgi:thioredoxin-related protein
MRKLINYLPLVLIWIMVGNLEASDIRINFSNESISSARKKAGEEGKLLFVGFHAKWCTPCTWMDQTTFKDANVTNTLNADFVALKIDIDDVQGFELKSIYGVKYLPTMLIFNSQGQLVERIEETMTPRLLLNVLNKHNAPENKIVIQHDLNTSPSLNNVSIDLGVNSDFNLSAEEYEKYYQQPQTETIYRVQVGVYTKYKSANNLIKSLRENFLEPITVTTEYKDNISYFKVCIGQFSRLEDAEKFRKILKDEYNIEGIVQ